MSLFKINEKTYNTIKCTKLNRVGVIEAVNLGTTLDNKHHRDVYGTRYNYTMNVYSQPYNAQEFDEFYDDITSPQNSISLEVPYGQNVFTFDAEVSIGEQSYERNENGGNIS